MKENFIFFFTFDFKHWKKIYFIASSRRFTLSFSLPHPLTPPLSSLTSPIIIIMIFTILKKIYSLYIRKTLYKKWKTFYFVKYYLRFERRREGGGGGVEKWNFLFFSFLGRHKCREEWPSTTSERAFNLFIDAILLLIPLVIMILAYSLIVHKLFKGLKKEIKND